MMGPTGMGALEWHRARKSCTMPLWESAVLGKGEMVQKLGKQETLTMCGPGSTARGGLVLRVCLPAIPAQWQ